MYKLLIADDDAMDRAGLCSLSLWQEMGIQVAGDAWNGKLALEMCLENPPDLVITDVRMPIMDGISLAKALKENCPETQVILASGFEDFTAARQAVHIGASAYLVKPIRRDELYNAVKTAIDSLRGVRAHSEQDERVKARLFALLPLEREHFLRNAMLGIGAERDPEILGFSGEEETYVILARLNPEALPREQRRQHLLMANDAMTAAAKEHGIDPPIAMGTDSSAFIATLPNMLTEDKAFSHIDGLARALLGAVRGHSPLHAVFGISPPARGISALRDQYEQALYAVKSGLSGGASRILWYEEGEENQPPPSVDGFVEGLITAMLRGDAQAIHHQTGGFFAETSVSHAKAVALAALARLSTELFRSGRDLKNAFDHGRVPYEILMENVMHAETTEDLTGYMAALFQKIMNALFTNRQHKSKSIVAQVMEILDKEFSEDISAEELSKRLYITASHLRRLFKNQTGQTIQEYVLALRMTKARELLINSDLLVNEVAYSVGYDNTSYFCMIFKRHYGTTPTEYRNA